jgi:subtilisin family serine protease
MDISNLQSIFSSTPQIPNDIKFKLISLAVNKNVNDNDNIEFIVLFGNSLDDVIRSTQALKVTFTNLGFGFGIIGMRALEFNKILQVEGVIYFELPKVVYTSDIGSNNESCVPEVWSRYNLTGKGVLIGFIDSGIDYTHPAFMDNAGNTRIEYIYDLSLNGQIWNKTKINEAIKSSDPFSVIPQKDNSGHGTHVAGIACGGGTLNRKYYGAAYESSIAMVKITAGGELTMSQSSLIMRGIKFLIDKSKELKMPLVISLSFSTNDGAHNGTSIFEQYISTVSRLEAVTFVIAAGNDGDRAIHAGGQLSGTKSIKLNISDGEKRIVLQIYKGILSDISLELRSPQGISTGVKKIVKGLNEGNIGANKYILYTTGGSPFDIIGEIILTIDSDQEFIESGIWSINLILDNNYESRYDIWLPISEGLNIDTKFQNPDIYNTLGIPATVKNVISVGSYNPISNTISSFSGRGQQESEYIKPDIVAPGENIYSAVPGGSVDRKSGTSMATPEVAGICALMNQWGIIQKNDVYLYGERLKKYIIRSARRKRTDVTYPNPTWGYGEICARNIFELLYLERREKYKKNNMRLSPFVDKNYSKHIAIYSGDFAQKASQISPEIMNFKVITDKYVVLAIRKDKLEEVKAQLTDVIYISMGLMYTLQATSPKDAANISMVQGGSYLDLQGAGVLVGIIDTGIDYLNEEFMYEDYTSRIVNIWDQTIDQNDPKVLYGVEYSRENINAAIRNFREGKDPYEIVKTIDEIGHGTNMAGIVGARGKDVELKGVVPKSEFIIVKLVQDYELKETKKISENIPVYGLSDIVTALDYIVTKAIQLEKPCAILLPLGTTFGSHDGTNVTEEFIDYISRYRGIVVVTGTGNDGAAESHVQGIIPKIDDFYNIELNVDKEFELLEIFINIKSPNKMSISVTSPSGEILERIPAKLQQNIQNKFILEETSVSVTYTLQQEISGNEIILINMQNLKPGLWKFRLYGDYIVDGIFDVWLPQSVFLAQGARFVGATPENTLTVPGTAERILTVGYYNQQVDTIVLDSGRGYIQGKNIKPDIAAGGINIVTTGTKNSKQTISGSSVAAAIVAGASAMLLEWGIVKGNDPTMYAVKVKAYLIRGAMRREGDIYPNIEWGFGKLNMLDTLENIRNMMRNNFKENSLRKCIFIRIPSSLSKGCEEKHE